MADAEAISQQQIGKWFRDKYEPVYCLSHTLSTSQLPEPVGFSRHSKQSEGVAMSPNDLFYLGNKLYAVFAHEIFVYDGDPSSPPGKARISMDEPSSDVAGCIGPSIQPPPCSQWKLCYRNELEDPSMCGAVAVGVDSVVLCLRTPQIYMKPTIQYHRIDDFSTNSPKAIVLLEEHRNASDVQLCNLRYSDGRLSIGGSNETASLRLDGGREEYPVFPSTITDTIGLDRIEEQTWNWRLNSNLFTYSLCSNFQDSAIMQWPASIHRVVAPLPTSPLYGTQFAVLIKGTNNIQVFRHQRRRYESVQLQSILDAGLRAHDAAKMDVPIELQALFIAAEHARLLETRDRETLFDEMYATHKTPSDIRNVPSLVHVVYSACYFRRRNAGLIGQPTFSPLDAMPVARQRIPPQPPPPPPQRQHQQRIRGQVVYHGDVLKFFYAHPYQILEQALRLDVLQDSRVAMFLQEYLAQPNETMSVLFDTPDDVVDIWIKPKLAIPWTYREYTKYCESIGFESFMKTTWCFEFARPVGPSSLIACCHTS